jgi:hypothetical protein
MAIPRTFRAYAAIALFLALVPAAPAQYSGGSGTPDDPYQIATAADLIALGETPEDYDKHFLLTADIDLDPNLPGRKVFDRAVIAPGWETCFIGVFDGRGHRISNLTITGESDLVGLFGRLGSDARVSNLGVEAVEVSGSGDYVGGLAGLNLGTLVRCYSTGTVSGDWDVGGLVGHSKGTVTQCYSAGSVIGNSRGGGLVGYNEGDVIQCYSDGTVTGESDVGGLVGMNGGEITYCYSISEVIGDSAVGGLVGANWGSAARRGIPGFVNQCYSTGMVSGAESVGGLVGDNKYDSTYWGPEGEGIVSDSLWDAQTSGQATSEGGTGKTTAEMLDKITFTAAGWDMVGQPDGPHDIWAEPEGGGYPILCWQLPPGFGLPTFSGGTGEPDNPYRISTTADLNSIGYNPRLMEAHFSLVEDIDLERTEFYVIGGEFCPFTGFFDGNGHTLSHLTIVGSSYLGMFGQLGSGGELINIVVEDVNVAGTGDYIGGLVGQNYKGTVIRCCSAGWISGDSSVGGLVGGNSGNITASYSSALVTGAGSVGGLTGSNFGVVIDCSSTGSVSGTGSNVGGLTGSNSGSVFRCRSTGGVTGVGQHTGGLAGYNSSGTVSQCFSAGSISGNSNVGGLVGTNQGNITTSYNSGAVNGNSTVGGLVGRNSGNVTTSYSTGAVRGSAYVGGLVGTDGEYPPRVARSVWDMETSGQSVSAGGVGLTTAEMMDPYMLGRNGFANDPNWVLDAGRD